MKFPGQYLAPCRERGPIPAHDLNEIQRQGLLNHLGARSAREHIVRDHFTGDQLDPVWSSVSNAAVPADDAANGAFGATRLDGSSGVKLLYTNSAWPVGGLNFSIAVRLRCPTLGAGRIFRCGLITEPLTGDDGQAFVGFQHDANGGDWLCSVSDVGGGALSGSITAFSSVAPSASYQLVEFHRRDRYACWRIDGKDVGSTEDFYVTASGDRVYVSPLVFYVYAIGTLDVWVDSVSFWAGETVAEGVNYRGAADWRTSGEAQINRPVHTESKYAALAAVTSVTVTWDQPFERDYRVYPSLQGAAAVDWLVTAKSETGVTLSFSAAVTGAIAIDAREVI